MAIRRTYSLVLLLLFASQASAQHAVFTIGPKIGYTLGEPGGITLGVEATYFPNVKDPATDKFRYGFTCAATFWEDNVSLHLGAEVIAMLALGIDVGPTMIVNDKGTSVGLGSIFFAGAIFYPYYEMTHFVQVDHRSFGAYFKLPYGLWAGESNGWWRLN